jgi:SAM-dependent methyltransferase
MGLRDEAGLDEHAVSQADGTREHLIETYRKSAKHYDVTSRLYPVPGYPQRSQRLRAVQALGLRAGGTVIDMACGTGLNFPLLQQAVGPGGRIIGVDLTDAMLARAQDRVKASGWGNVSLVQADAAGFGFPAGADAILSTYALTQVPECAQVIAHGTAAGRALGRAGPQDPHQYARVAGAARDRDGTAVRLHRPVDHPPPVGNDPRGHARRTRRLHLDRVVPRNRVPRRRVPRPACVYGH